MFSFFHVSHAQAHKSHVKKLYKGLQIKLYSVVFFFVCFILNDACTGTLIYLALFINRYHMYTLCTFAHVFLFVSFLFFFRFISALHANNVYAVDAQ